MPHPPTTKRRDAERSHTAILVAAREQLASASDTPLSAIARAAGVGQATLYRHFADRQALIAAIFEEGLERLEAKAARAAEDDPASAFLLILRAAAAEAAHFHGLVAILREGSDGAARVADLTERVLALFRQPLADARAAGIVRSDLAAEDVVTVLAMIDGGLAQAGDPAERGQLAARALELLLEGVIRPGR